MRTRRPASERGAVAVEAALVIPILMLLVFGIIEMSLLLRDSLAVTSSVRAGGRVASALAGAGPAGVNEGGDCTAPCTPANAPMLAQMAANAVQTSGSALPEDSVQELWVFRANPQGFPGAAGNDEWTCTVNCVRFRWVPARDQFRYLDGAWASATINACVNSSPDTVGIYLRARHDFITGLFGAGLDVSDSAVFTFEPLPALTCAAGTHP
ncbi:hypothetical protein ENKNEFLB_01386 [Nocardioides aquaticus]|uniref:TadE-like domain-containing protein n=1 Tax=Nocardioides aquaticus TaxID=160826 RepID=A0ABX8EHC1_9ACTN|nr:TadE/TadG family type IV pilus assembly protein [Nocardioides aquaticus]QVT79006.1 hypothetical protein ENKNEFLB_01386 [Nocardioides aquaticus]